MEKEIVKLFLEKLEKLTEAERVVILESIKWLNTPIITSTDKNMEVFN